MALFFSFQYDGWTFEGSRSWSDKRLWGSLGEDVAVGSDAVAEMIAVVSVATVIGSTAVAVTVDASGAVPGMVTAAAPAASAAGPD